MEILPASQKLALLEYLSLLRYGLAEWLIVETKIGAGGPGLSGDGVAGLLQKTFSACEGRILVCNAAEILMLIKWGQEKTPVALVKEVRAQLPEKACEIVAVPPTREGLRKIGLMIAEPASEHGPHYAARIARRENVFLVADDDMYMRSLTKQGLKGRGAAVEAGTGDAAVAAYKKHNPDVVLLDIHMPGVGGADVLRQIRQWDPSAYVIMLSADSSRENVEETRRHGARGFLAKPFDKAKLLECIDACPTVK